MKGLNSVQLRVRGYGGLGMLPYASIFTAPYTKITKLVQTELFCTVSTKKHSKVTKNTKKNVVFLIEIIQIYANCILSLNCIQFLSKTMQKKQRHKKSCISNKNHINLCKLFSFEIFCKISIQNNSKHAKRQQ